MPSLLIRRGDAELARHPLQRNRTSVGARPSCEVCLPDAGVRDIHGFVEKRSGGYFFVTAGGEAEVELLPGRPMALGDFSIELSFDKGPWKVRQTEAVLESPGVIPSHVLVVFEGKERTVELPAELIVGTNPGDGGLAFDDPTISARHLVLIRTERGLWLEDLGSTNGTDLVVHDDFRHPQRVKSCRVEVGNRIIIGGVQLIPTTGAAEDNDPAAMIGSSRAMLDVLELIGRVAQAEESVLVTGETGTGKELVARQLHGQSSRGRGPFEVINCAGIASTLIESELFGHEKGAFTGADKLRKGIFESASGGTLFLDEIGELPMEQQAKLLRVLQQKTLRRVGGNQDIKVDVRVIAATHVDLALAVHEKRFREDLFYRLNVLKVELPPLRERRGDARMITEAVLRKLAIRSTPATLTDRAWTKLLAHTWPGNVRELENTIRRALVLRKNHEQQIDAHHLTFEGIVSAADRPASATGPDGWVKYRGRPLVDTELEIIERVMDECGDQKLAADRLGIGVRTLQRRLDDIKKRKESERS